MDTQRHFEVETSSHLGVVLSVLGVALFGAFVCVVLWMKKEEVGSKGVALMYTIGESRTRVLGQEVSK